MTLRSMNEYIGGGIWTIWGALVIIGTYSGWHIASCSPHGGDFTGLFDLKTYFAVSGIAKVAFVLVGGMLARWSGMVLDGKGGSVGAAWFLWLALSTVSVAWPVIGWINLVSHVPNNSGHSWDCSKAFWFLVFDSIVAFAGIVFFAYIQLTVYISGPLLGGAYGAVGGEMSRAKAAPAAAAAADEYQYNA